MWVYKHYYCISFILLCVYIKNKKNWEEIQHFIIAYSIIINTVYKVITNNSQYLLPK